MSTNLQLVFRVTDLFDFLSKLIFRRSIYQGLGREVKFIRNKGFIVVVQGFVVEHYSTRTGD